MNNKLYFDLICLKAVLARLIILLILSKKLVPSCPQPALSAAERVVQFRAFRELRGETPENATKMSQMQNEPKTNPNEPNFSKAKTDSKPKNEDFRQIYELFMLLAQHQKVWCCGNKPNGMLYIN